MIGLMVVFLMVFYTCGRSRHLEVFLGKGVLKICSKFTGEQPCQSATSIKLLCFVCCSEHLFLRTPLDGCFCCGKLVLRGVGLILGNGQKHLKIS